MQLNIYKITLSSSALVGNPVFKTEEIFVVAESQGKALESCFGNKTPDGIRLAGAPMQNLVDCRFIGVLSKIVEN